LKLAKDRYRLGALRTHSYLHPLQLNLGVRWPHRDVRRDGCALRRLSENLSPIELSASNANA
jgi:hypothetical protein